MPLTDAKIRNAKPAEKAVKLFDERGLYLEVSPAGGKWWRLKYRSGGKEKRLSLGVYPDVGLKEARERREEARALLANGIDPSEHRKAQKATQQDQAANSFEIIAREWHGSRSPGWAPGHASKIIRRLELDVFPWIGSRPIAAVTAPELLATVRRIETRGALETAHRALQNCGQIFRYAVATGRAERDPS
ncbi:putative integrase prophage protein, partial [Thiorhodococcus drewsii AZ1]